MHRRDFILHAASLAAAGMAIASCTTTAPTTAEPVDAAAAADKRRRDIDAAADATLARLYTTAQGSQALVVKANGVLVFPRVFAAGLVVGGQYGEGALRANGMTEGYYSLTSVSPGLQAGADEKAVILLFMTREALDRFRAKPGWTVGIDAAVAVLSAGADGLVQAPTDTPAAAFVLTNAGLMANLSLEGTKISPIKI